MPISREDVKEIALLARLALTEAEVERYQSQLAHILEYIEQLQRLDTTGVEPTTHVAAVTSPLREDRPAPSLLPERALAAAPRRNDALFEVPRILPPGEDEEGA